METKIVYIYSIADPRDGKVFYVGKTENPKSRFSSHFTTNSKNTSKIIGEIKSKKLKPIFTILEICGKQDWYMMEKKWCDKYLSEGCVLLNSYVQKKINSLPYDAYKLDGVEFDLNSLKPS